MQKQKIITGILVLLIIGMLTIVVLGSKSKDKNTIQKVNNQKITEGVAINDKAPIFFYGNTCPHCKEVEEWMKVNKIEEKIEIIKKEVYDNNTNSFELSKVAESCGMNTSSIGVPFLYTSEETCLVGTTDIISYLSNKIAISDHNQATESGKEIGL